MRKWYKKIDELIKLIEKLTALALAIATLITVVKLILNGQL